MSNGYYNQIPTQESQPIDIYQRQDSVFGNMHAQPQHVQHSFNSRNFRRDSIAHSQGVGGVSWGSVTIGSWLKEEVLMHNHMSQFQQAHGNQGNLNQTSMSPPVQSSYLPDLEANYCKDYSCCGQLLPTLHDLLKHYEESHISPTPPTHQPKPIQNFDTVSTTDVFINNANQMNQMNAATNNAQRMNGAANQRSQFGFNNTASPFQQQQVNQIRNSLSHQLNMGQQNNGNLQHQQQLQQLQQQQLQQQQHNQQQYLLAQMQQGQVPDQFQQQQQQLHLQQQMQHNNQQMAGQQQSAPFPISLNNDDSAMVLDDEQEEHFIDDPSRNLYVAQGSDKPFTCPVIGCNKTYKNQNGLKYHRLHGHQNQKLHQNPDGTYSVIDPNDSNSMEQDKPYRCEVCGKRYKNLNGLKYHRGHTTH